MIDIVISGLVIGGSPSGRISPSEYAREKRLVTQIKLSYSPLQLPIPGSYDAKVTEGIEQGSFVPSTKTSWTASLGNMNVILQCFHKAEHTLLITMRFPPLKMSFPLSIVLYERHPFMAGARRSPMPLSRRAFSGFVACKVCCDSPSVGSTLVCIRAWSRNEDLKKSEAEIHCSSSCA